MTMALSKKHKNRILIIDDDQTVAVILMEFLKNKNFIVSYATEVRNIDELLSNEKPDLIFLDYRMSPLTGKDILERINLQAHPVPVVMMSAYRTREGVFEVKNLGALDYINKPFDFNEIDIILGRVFAS
jgi:DNA-binding response OmpR family regulator